MKIWYDVSMSKAKFKTPAIDWMFHIDQQHSMALLTAILVVCNFTLFLPRIRAIEDMVFHYYHTLPLASNSDVDRDGIVDDLDDTDGDGIPDYIDISPFGIRGPAASEVVRSNQHKYGTDSLSNQ